MKNLHRIFCEVKDKTGLNLNPTSITNIVKINPYFDIWIETHSIDDYIIIHSDVAYLIEQETPKYLEYNKHLNWLKGCWLAWHSSNEMLRMYWMFPAIALTSDILINQIEVINNLLYFFRNKISHQLSKDINHNFETRIKI